MVSGFSRLQQALEPLDVLKEKGTQTQMYYNLSFNRARKPSKPQFYHFSEPLVKRRFETRKLGGVSEFCTALFLSGLCLPAHPPLEPRKQGQSARSAAPSRDQQRRDDPLRARRVRQRRRPLGRSPCGRGSSH